jgi:flagellar biosynthesis/type III secretory pathway chaperone
MDAATCKAELGRIMAEETRLLNELVSLLEREHGFLQADDAASLESTARERQKCIAGIYRCDEERRDLCHSTGRAQDLKGLEELMRWCDPQGTLIPGWAQCSAVAANCRQLNDRNAALVGARLKQVQARLGVLIDGRRDGMTYGRRGTDTPPSSGRLVATEA